MHTWVGGWNWIWMAPMMGFWVVLVGALVFLAVRPPTKPRAGS